MMYFINHALQDFNLGAMSYFYTGRESLALKTRPDLLQVLLLHLC